MRNNLKCLREEKRYITSGGRFIKDFGLIRASAGLSPLETFRLGGIMDAIKNGCFLHRGVFYLEDLQYSREKSLKYRGKSIVISGN